MAQGKSSAFFQKIFNGLNYIYWFDYFKSKKCVHELTYQMSKLVLLKLRFSEKGTKN